MHFPGFLKEKLLIILVSRTVFFFFLMCLITIFLYTVGTVQDFIDSTQLYLLKFYVILGIFLITFSICSIILGMKRFFEMKKSRYLFRVSGYLFFVIFGMATVLIAIFIITITGGNIG